jgi:3'5'-cyclic nucleotide phosphodiesterase
LNLLFCSENPFHNFEHASHVASATLKLLHRVLSPDISLDGTDASKNQKKALQALVTNLHSSTYGITSDPLTQFAIVFAALVHDVDHRGVSNGQLVSERDPLALRYNNESVAEQNSVAVAWELLLRPCYGDLRAALFGSHSDMVRFRQLVINSVMATDIFDAHLKAMRELRWGKAFCSNSKAVPADRRSSSSSEDVNRMATIVIEHLIHAGDVSHTMQHWHVYRVRSIEKR